MRLEGQGYHLRLTRDIEVAKAYLRDRYLKRLLANARVLRYLAHHHAEVGAEFQRLVDAPDLNIAAG